MILKNILSYTNQLKGKEIKEWIRYHSEHSSEYSMIAIHMQKYLNISDNDMYMVIYNSKGTGCGERNKWPILIKNKESID